MFDVVRGLIQLPLVEGAAGKVVNFGSEHEISICDLAKTVKKLCRSQSEIVFTPYETAYGRGLTTCRDASRV